MVATRPRGSIESLGVDVDRTGQTGTLCETYPRAALNAWGYTRKGKVDWAALSRHFDFLSVRPEVEPRLVGDDVCDAVVCALIARARDLGQTERPRHPEEGSAAAREGWIHVSLQDRRRLVG